MKGLVVMRIYRSTMEKILSQMEDDTLITNSKDPFRAFYYKLIYMCCYHADRLRQIYRRVFRRQ